MNTQSNSEVIKAIAEAHTIAVQQIERIVAAAVAFYQAKQSRE